MLILEAPFFSLRDLSRHHYPFMPVILLDLVFKYPMRSDLWISEVKCPVFLFHGMRDDIVPYDSSERLLKLIRTEGKLIAIPDGGHNNLSDFRYYNEQLDQILN